MTRTRDLATLDTISGNSAALLGKSAEGIAGYIPDLLDAEGKFAGITDITDRLDTLEAVTIDQTFNKESANAQSGTAVEDAFKQHRVIQGSTGTSYMANETTGGLFKFTATNGDFGKVTAFDGSDSEHTYVQVVASKGDKSKIAKLNFTVDGAFYSKESGGATAIADNEILTKKDIKELETNSAEIKEHLQDTDTHVTTEEKTKWEDKYTKSEIDEKLAQKADMSSLTDGLALKADLDTTNAELKKKADRVVVETALARKVEQETLDAHIDDTTKHLGTIHTDAGDALIFNEADGGGVRFTHTDGAGSLIAVNNGADDVYAQINAHTKGKAKIVRLNVNPNGIYYTKNAKDNQVSEDNELVTKEEIKDIVAAETVTALTERIETLEGQVMLTVDQSYGFTSHNPQSGTAVAEAIAPLAKDADLTAHTSNADIHVTTDDKTNWADKYTKEEVDRKIEDVINRMDTLVKPVVDQTYNAESANAQSGMAVAQAIDNQRNITTGGNSAYMSNESTGGVMKYTKSTGEMGKVTLFDGSDSDNTFVQIVAHNSDKSSLAMLNFSPNGIFYSKSAELAGASAADNELVTVAALNAKIAELSVKITELESKVNGGS